ncbi:MAG: hypothetical protein R2739_00475 [Chitinophagales bacterium]|nr:hypothetical protein [Bacteroidota bacterium]
MIKKAVIYFLVIFIIVDVIVGRFILHLGFDYNTKEYTIQRLNVPYIEFTGNPNYKEHNTLGYKGKGIESITDSTYTILFFAGSTGYYGDTTLPQFIEIELNKNKHSKPYNILNCSVVSANHNQHLHALVEQFLTKKIDLVIFYGGYNELINPLYYDPRAGYPFNYYYKNDCNPFILSLLKYSSILGEIERRHYAISGLRKLRKQYESNTKQWYDAISKNYLDVMQKSSIIVTHCMTNCVQKPTQFICIHQPFQVPEQFKSTEINIRNQLKNYGYTYDISDIFKNQSSYFIDDVHLNNAGNKIVAQRISKIIESVSKNAVVSK